MGKGLNPLGAKPGSQVSHHSQSAHAGGERDASNRLPKISWWHVGRSLSNQLITPPSAGGNTPSNSTTALDHTFSLGTGLKVRQPLDKLEGWSLNLHLRHYGSTGNFGAVVGLVSSQSYPQSLFQSPSGLWLQGLWLKRHGLPHERLAQLKLSNHRLGNSLLTRECHQPLRQQPVEYPQRGQLAWGSLRPA